jgi:PAS domain S-box-containing protein
MLQNRLIFLLLLLILLPTLVVGWIAYRFSFDNIRTERINIVGRVAESRHEQLKLVLQRTNNRANAFLSDMLVKCVAADKLNQACASGLIGDYLHTEGAIGALFFRRGATEGISVGTPSLSIADIGEFQPEQLARFSKRTPNQPRFYYIITGNPTLSWQLVIIYPVSLIQPIFVNHPDLGKSGETFLADSAGFFITQAAYPTAQLYSHYISVQPMQTCLNQQNTERLDVDYRGKPVIHGFQYIPEIGGGCIMAHIEQAEAFAPLRILEKQLLGAVVLFIVLTVVIARALARRIIDPIIRLTHTARRIQDGDHSIRAEVNGHDEISELASSFNHMTDALADAQHNLEARVEVRTQELRTSQERYMLAERAVNDGIWDWNIVSHEYYLSPRWNKILGYKEGELPNVESIFFDLIHPDDKASASEAFRRHLECNERYCTELRLRHKDGSYRWVLDRGEAIRDDEGRPVRMVGSITEITERKAAEAELLKYREHLEELVAIATAEVKAIVQTAVNGVISIDASGAIRTFNPAAERLFGWSCHEIIGKNVSLLMPEPDASAHDSYIQRFLTTNQSNIIGTDREVVARRKDGSYFAANLAVGHGVISEGRHIFVGFVSDISLQKQTEQELRLAKETAETATKAKASFLANMSHEIRTPMNTIIGFAEVALQDKNLSQDTRKHINIILSSGKHLLNVINDILDFSKIEAGKIQLESVCFNLPHAVQEALQTVCLRASEKGLRIELNIDAGLSQYFVGDPNRLRQVLLNLVGNSVKFTESGVITIVIDKAEGVDSVHFAIHDTGIGMTAEQTARVFESFSQADTTTSRRFGGTGLGTTISKQLVELMGGRIWVESTLGVGSTFHFTVHLPETTFQESCLYQTQANHNVEYFSPRSFNVLLAEDIEANATLAILRLEQQGHHVTWVKNGQEAVDAFTNGHYDLILMDLQMPVLDGLNATRRIRELEASGNSRIPIAALTASVLHHEREQCTQAGMDAIIGKPINVDELLEQMETLVAKGAGTARTVIKVENNQPLVSIDFTPLLTVADSVKALATWREPLVYANALLHFADERTDDATQMQRLFTENPNDTEPVRRIAHALKGVAGNLMLLDIFPLATELDACLKNGDMQRIPEQLTALDTALKIAATAIRRLQLPIHTDNPTQQPLAPEQIRALLQQLLAALDTLNPDNIEPILQQLAPFIDEAGFNIIHRQVDNFDFDSAKTEAQKLLARFTAPLDGDAT